MFTPRPAQAAILNYRAGRMGVAAVPGSGKTHVLSALAAEIISRGILQDDQEVLIVTLVNSAVDNFAARISEMVKQRGLLPHLGYRVRTLHGLAHDIVGERPSLVQLDNDFQIIDERLASQIRDEAAQAWLHSNPYALDNYLDADLDEERRNWVHRDQLPDLVNEIALGFIRTAKDLQVTPETLRQRLENLPVPLPLAEMGYAIYTDYQRALAYRGAVDFDDLIRLALQALQSDEGYLERLRYRWPYILEDEAQDSSRLQEHILRLLTGPTGNWVRVGDPNQAIYETFTTASPKYLLDFLGETGVEERQLPNSGRSTLSIINLANYLIDWAQSDHPLEYVQQALSLPHIEPTPPGDPQPNPTDNPQLIQFIPNKFTPQEEVLVVADSLQRWLPEHPDETVAALVPRNQRGYDLVNELKRRNLDYIEILQSTSSTRQAAGVLGAILHHISDPQSPRKLAEAYKAWQRAMQEDDIPKRQTVHVAELLRKCRNVEDFLWPRLEQDWLEEVSQGGDVIAIEELTQFRDLVQRWQGTALLPIDQAVLAIAQDLFTEPVELAIAHKLAIILRQASDANPAWRLPDLAEELSVVARNERRFLGFSQDDTGFDPERHKGKVVIATIHKAKGLEWDRVYLMSVNTYDFPSTMVDHFISEKWFIRDHLNLEAEALDQLKTAFSTDEYTWYEEGAPTRLARQEYIAERLRLLYVGLTRAKKELVVTWNTGRKGDQKSAIPLLALQTYWEEQGFKR